MVLKKNVHKKLLRLHRLVGKEIRSRHHFRLNRVCDLLEVMSDVIVLRDSWERGKSR